MAAQYLRKRPQQGGNESVAAERKCAPSCSGHAAVRPQKRSSRQICVRLAEKATTPAHVAGTSRDNHRTKVPRFSGRERVLRFTMGAVKPTAVIVGAGPNGLTAAARLAVNGWRVDVRAVSYTHLTLPTKRIV